MRDKVIPFYLMKCHYENLAANYENLGTKEQSAHFSKNYLERVKKLNKKIVEFFKDYPEERKT